MYNVYYFGVTKVAVVECYNIKHLRIGNSKHIYKIEYLTMIIPSFDTDDASLQSATATSTDKKTQTFKAAMHILSYVIFGM
jgi:hypothetical protein